MFIFLVILFELIWKTLTEIWVWVLTKTCFSDFIYNFSYIGAILVKCIYINLNKITKNLNIFMKIDKFN
jgi:hypothetical protein